MTTLVFWTSLKALLQKIEKRIKGGNEIVASEFLRAYISSRAQCREKRPTPE